MHKAMKHPTKQKHVCSHCPASFSVSTQLLHHITNRHKEKSVECPHVTCKYMSKTSTSVKNHYVRTHMNPKLLFKQFDDTSSECLTCESLFKTSAIFYHVSICSPVSPFHRDKDEVRVRPVQKRVVAEKGRDFESEIDIEYEIERRIEERQRQMQMQQMQQIADDDDNQSLFFLAQITEDDILAMANCNAEERRQREIMPINVNDQYAGYDDDLDSIDDDNMFASLLS